MRRKWKLIAECFFVFALLLIPSGVSEGQWSDPGLVNRMISDVIAPILAPGEQAELSLVFENPFPVPISSIAITAEPYVMVFADGSSDWAGLTDTPRLVNRTSDSSSSFIDDLSPNQNRTVAWSVVTTSATSRGGIFDQSSYFVRLTVTFEVGNEIKKYASAGVFTKEQWDHLQDTAGNDPTGFNMTYLSELGYSGIIPDLSFIVRDVIPIWPVAIIVGAAAFTGVVGLYYYLKVSPMAAPRTYGILVNARRRLEKVFRPRKKSG